MKEFLMRVPAALGLSLATVCAPGGLGTLNAQELKAPHVEVQVIAPGAVVVRWTALMYADVAGFVVQRVSPAPRSVELNRQESSFTDLNLQPSTEHRYSVCTVFARTSEHVRKCSDTVSVRTMPPESGRATRLPPVPSVAHGGLAQGEVRVTWQSHDSFDFFQLRYGRADARPQADRQVDRIGPAGRSSRWTLRGLQPDQVYRVTVQGCRARGVTSPFSSTCTDFSQPLTFMPAVAPAAKPVVQVNRSRSGVRRVALQWTVSGHQINEVRVLRNGAQVSTGGQFSTFEDGRVRPNTEYRYAVCIINPAGEVCSDPITATGTLTPPTAPADVTVIKLGNAAGLPTRPGEASSKWVAGALVHINWKNAASASYIPGRYVIAERLDSGPITADREGRIRAVWREVGRVDGSADPVRLAVTHGAELGIQAGNSFRVCSVVPELGARGRVCSGVVVLR